MLQQYILEYQSYLYQKLGIIKQLLDFSCSGSLQISVDGQIKQNPWCLN